MELLNKIVKEKEDLLISLRTFTNKINEKEDRLKHKSGWKINKRGLISNETKEKDAINRNIDLSNESIKTIIPLLDKNNRLYKLIMNKNEIITKSINILNKTEPYNKYDETELNNNDMIIVENNSAIDIQLRVQEKAKSPPRVQEKSKSPPRVQEKSKSPPRVQANARSPPKVQEKARSPPRVQANAISPSSDYSHSYRSNSSQNLPNQDDYHVYNKNAELVLINAIGDGDCFINAIFDYGLYTGKLVDIYDRLKHLELLILSIKKYQNNISKAISLFDNVKPTLDILTEQEYTKLLQDNRILVEETPIETERLRNIYNIDKSQTFTSFRHPYPLDKKSEGFVLYSQKRKIFIKFMKYIQVLYIYTFGYKLFINILKNSMGIVDNVDILDWDHKLINFVKEKYYNSEGKMKNNIDFNILLNDYMKIYVDNDGFFTCADQIFIFRKIFFKKLKYKKNTKKITRFWLNIDTQGSINIATKKFSFKNLGIPYKFSENGIDIYEYISIIRDGPHFKLFVYRENMIIESSYLLH
jgi:hypothetical protein